jgi:glycerophosphoryl diester phosphodiesterase
MARQVDIIGHRGARGLFPENTMEGFRQTFALGVRTFELDVGMTRDGVVVVSHDLALNPSITRDASGRFISGPPPLLREMTFAALRAYDVGRIRPGTSYRLTHRSQIPCDGARIPALADVLADLPDARFVIELKTDPRYPERTVPPAELADATLSVIDAAGATGRVILESFDWRGPIHIHRTRPEIPLAWLTHESTVRGAARWWAGVTAEQFNGSVPAAVASQGGGSWASHWESLTRAQIAEAHHLGLRVIPWTVNRRTAMRRLAAWEVDGLITDRPDLALREVQSV